MGPHVHVGLVEFLTIAASVVIFTFLWRMAIAAVGADRPLGRAMAAVYS